MRSTPLVRLLASTAVASCLLAVAAPTGASAAPTAGSTAEPRLEARQQPLRPHRTGVAAPATTASSSIDVVVPLHISAASRRAVDALSDSALSRAERQTRMRSLAPRASQARAVRGWAARHGFAVTATTPWSVSLRGRAGELATAFGTTLNRRGIGGKGFVTPRTAPRVPAELQGVADAVVGLDTRPHFRGRGVYGGGDVQVLTSTPVRGSAAGNGATVATVNLSGWHASDLTTYRQAAFGSTAAAAMPAPATVLVGARLTAGNATATVQEDDFGLETEVALDAEAIAGIAPSAKQQMYFGGNSSADYIGILDRMVQDLMDGNPNNDFQTASTSWGACELALPASDLDAMSLAISNITALGATFFAASGDSGSYGCYDGMTAAVDFPASAPDTVAVGGTTVTGTAPSYTSTAWDGSGGGCSQVFAAPARQSLVASPCTGRAVPDIANIADPNSGFWVFDRVNEWIPVGGTSLAAPASAAGLATAMADAGLTSLPLNQPSTTFLAKAYANQSAFTDVTTGNNGLYKATAGYDLVTGLGSPIWTAVETALTGSPTPAPTTHNEPLLAAVPTWDTTTASLEIPVSPFTTLNGIVPNGEPVDGYAAAANCSVTTAQPPTQLPFPPAPAQGAYEFPLSVHTTDANVPSGCIPVTRPVVLDSVKPVVSSVVASYVGTTRPAYRFSWTASDSGTGVLFYLVYLKDLTTGAMVLNGEFTTGRAFPYPTAAPLYVTPGHSYAVEVDAYDGSYVAGFRDAVDTAGYRITSFLSPYDDRSASLSSGWSRVSSKYDYMASHLQSARTGSYLQMRFTGKTFTAGMLKSRYGGYVDVYVDGVKKFRYSLYASSSLYRQQVRLATFTTRASHTVTLKVVGAHASGSLGNYVYLDSYTVA